MVDEREALRERTKAAIRGWLQSRGMVFVSDETAAEGADAVLAVLPSRETDAPTREVIRQQIMRAWERHPNSPTNVFDRAADYVLALFPGDSREAVEAKALRDAAGAMPDTLKSTLWLRDRADRIETHHD